MKQCTLLCLVLALSAVSCASYQPGYLGTSVSTGDEKQEVKPSLVVSGEKSSVYSTDYFAFYSLTFTNPTSEWKRIKSATLSFSPDIDNREGVILSGEDLGTWCSAIELKTEIDNYNRELFLGTAALAASAVSVKGGSKLSMNVSLAGASVLVLNEVITKKSDLERSELFPANHLYRTFSVPPGLFVRKWAVVRLDRKDQPKEIYVNLTFTDTTTARYKINVALSSSTR